MRSMARSKVIFKNLSDAEDTIRLKKMLKLIKSCATSNIPMVVDAGNAGTVMRFLTAFLSQFPGTWLLTGNKRMQERPIGVLVEALQLLGADIKYLEKSGTPPLYILGKDIKGGKIKINTTTISSQFITALMLIAPYLKGGLQIIFDTKPISFSYITMSAKLMEMSGITVDLKADLLTIPEGKYRLKPFTIEADWSSAAYWYQTVAYGKNNSILLNGLINSSLQGDKALIEIFNMLGVNTIFKNNGVLIKKGEKVAQVMDYNFSDCPDIVPTVLATCAALKVKGIFRGIEHLRYKESDRIEKMQNELIKIGATLYKEKDYYILASGKTGKYFPVFDTYGDHRLAMCFAPLTLIYDKIQINNADVVIKSYPTFWRQFAQTKLINIKPLNS